MAKNTKSNRHPLKGLASKNPINLALARKVVKVVNAGLSEGLGEPIPGQMCVEAAVNYALGAKHGDGPKCVDPSVRRFKITLNDSGIYNDEKDRGKVLRRIAVAQLGSDIFGSNTFPRAIYELTGGVTIEKSIKSLRSSVESPASKFLLNEIESVLKNEGFAAACLLIEYLDLDGIDWFDMGDFDTDSLYDTVRSHVVNGEGGSGLLDRAATKKMAELGVKALRRCGSPGIALMDKLIAEKAL